MTEEINMSGLSYKTLKGLNMNSPQFHWGKIKGYYNPEWG